MPSLSLPRFFRYSRALIRDWYLLLREFWGPLLALLTTSLIVASLFVLFYPANTPTGRLAFDEALYLVVTLTVIEGAYPPPSQNHWLIIFYFIMPFIGILIAGTGLVNFFTLLFNRQARGQTWKVVLAGTLSRHIVVCGGGRVGSQVVRNLLQSGVDIVVIEQNAAQMTADNFNNQNAILLEGDVRDYEMLKQAGIQRAEAVIVCTDNDLANLECAIHCRELNADIRIILRMFDADLAQKVKGMFGIEAAMSSSAVAAPIFAGEALDLDMQQSFYVEDELMSIARLTIQPESSLEGMSIGTIEQEMNASIVMHINEGVRDLHPAPEKRLQSGTTILALASLPTLTQLGNRNSPTPNVNTSPAYVVVCGGGRVGNQTVRNLLESGTHVVVIEQDGTRETVHAMRQKNVTVLEGDIRDYELLKQTGIERATAVIVCTDDDMANLECAIHCRELNENIRIVLRMFDADLARKVKDSFQIQAAFSSSTLSAPVFAGTALELEVQHRFYLDNELVSLVRIEVRKASRLDGMKVGDVEAQLDASLLLYVHNGIKTLHPADEVLLLGGCTILVLANIPTLTTLGHWNRTR